MNKELRGLNGSIYDLDIIKGLYGNIKDFIKIVENGLSTSASKEIYNFMILEVTHRNTSLIPSRNEKRAVNVKWGTVWKNFKLRTGLTPEEKCFSWKIVQDMLPVGSRIHRLNAEKRCLVTLSNGNLCQDIQTIEHAFVECPLVKESYDIIIAILTSYLQRPVTCSNLVHFSFNHRRKSRLKCALWFSIKALFSIFYGKCFNKSQLLNDIIKEVDWNLRLNRYVGSLADILDLRSNIVEII